MILFLDEGDVWKWIRLVDHDCKLGTKLRRWHIASKSRNSWNKRPCGLARSLNESNEEWSVEYVVRTDKIQTISLRAWDMLRKWNWNKRGKRGIEWLLFKNFISTIDGLIWKNYVRKHSSYKGFILLDTCRCFEFGTSLVNLVQSR